MKAVAEIQVIPIGAGLSVRREVARAQEILRECGLAVEGHAFGTNVEGELDAVVAAVERLHETLHAEGVQRLSTIVKIGTRTDKEASLAAKRITPAG